MKELKDRVAVVTGGASGIGYGMLTAFAAEGMKLVMADIETEALEASTARLRDAGATVIGVGSAIWCNYFYGKVFASTVICFMTPLIGLAYLFSLMFDHDFTPQPIWTDFKPELWLGLGSLAVAIVVLTAIAIAASARLGQVMTLCVTLGMFLVGLMSDWLRQGELEGVNPPPTQPVD